MNNYSRKEVVMKNLSNYIIEQQCDQCKKFLLMLLIRYLILMVVCQLYHSVLKIIKKTLLKTN